MNSYSVKVVRLAGVDPISKKATPEDFRTLPIPANTPNDAVKQARRTHGMTVMGQDLEFYVDGDLFLGNH